MSSQPPPGMLPPGMLPLKRNLREQLVEQLGGDIVRGRLRPGDPLPNEEELLTRYDVSRTVLREALNVLSGKGLLDAKPRRGTIVRPRSDWSQLDPAILGWRDDPAQPAGDNLDQLMELRRIIEPAAAELAARRGTADDHAMIAKAYDAMVAAGDDVPAFVDADVNFHVACLTAARNEFLLPVTHAIRASLIASMRITNRDSEQNRRVTLPLHAAIRDAILVRDGSAARKAMQVHLDNTERRRAALAKPIPAKPAPGKAAPKSKR
ncbi:MAG TPA: FadR/GntR family transcriptional regulator [Rhodopila sp.]|uniref:FadR/GntR family transcriptional regulator n=1 Tax=Rhodopila sp. TaxID=2480087 RepID=UPI002CD79C38|nr:FadR/GntR family transcriptional regulator [Rhodopila sp.]HVY16793.1 FadR/GntR family transcriptional regulator [Rhodopila sp.]